VYSTKGKITLKEYKKGKNGSRKIGPDKRHYRNQYGTPLTRIRAVIPFSFSILYDAVPRGDCRWPGPSLGFRGWQKFVAR
jgi:hypothetical protein